MATKFNCFWLDLALGRHNLASDALKVLLTNTAPLVTAAVPGDIADALPAGNGYPAGGIPITTVSAGQVGGVFSLVLADKTITATGSIGPWRYAVLYNSTSGRLIQFADYNSSATTNTGDPILIDFPDGAAISIT